jgi:hypothetical protein
VCWVGGWVTLSFYINLCVCVCVCARVKCVCILAHMEKDRVKGYCILFPYSEVKSCQKFQFKCGFLDIYIFVISSLISEFSVLPLKYNFSSCNLPHASCASLHCSPVL